MLVSGDDSLYFFRQLYCVSINTSFIAVCVGLSKYTSDILYLEEINQVLNLLSCAPALGFYESQDSVYC